MPDTNTITDEKANIGHVKRKVAAFEKVASQASASGKVNKVSLLTAKFEGLAAQSIFQKPVTTSDSKEDENERVLTQLVNKNTMR